MGLHILPKGEQESGAEWQPEFLPHPAATHGRAACCLLLVKGTWAEQGLSFHRLEGLIRNYLSRLSRDCQIVERSG